ncbi:hypothetical protein NFI96_020707, partial [Prochilodus magdalenae]
CQGQDPTTTTTVQATKSPGTELSSARTSAGTSTAASTGAPESTTETQTNTSVTAEKNTSSLATTPASTSIGTYLKGEVEVHSFLDTRSSDKITQPPTTNVESVEAVTGTDAVKVAEKSCSNCSVKAETSTDQKPPTVFVSLLVTGLLIAALLIGGYVWKNRRSNGKGMKLADDSVMADEENQGNTLVSVAPLNPPEPQEKPSLNGESPEAVKTQNPPTATNGHSTTKTSDTEL